MVDTWIEEVKIVMSKEASCLGSVSQSNGFWTAEWKLFLTNGIKGNENGGNKKRSLSENSPWKQR